MYIQGDTIPNIGIVECNHCGFPWPIGVEYKNKNTNWLDYCGVVQIDNKDFLGNSIFCDAISGKRLCEAEFEARKGNYIYDYERKSRNWDNWRKKNRLRVIKGQIAWHKYEKDLTLIGYIRCLKEIIKLKLKRKK